MATTHFGYRHVEPHAQLTKVNGKILIALGNLWEPEVSISPCLSSTSPLVIYYIHISMSSHHKILRGCTLCTPGLQNHQL